MKYLSLIFTLLISVAGKSQINDWENLKRYAAENSILHTQPSSAKRVVFMGDSITEGWITADRSFFYNKPYINRGISGQTTPQMLLRFRDDVITLKPKVVVILAGINDIAGNTGIVTLDYIFGNIVSMVQLAKANGITPVLCSVLPAFDFPWRRGLQPVPKILKLNEMIQAYAQKNNFLYVDYHSALKDEKGGLATQYSNDGVHPTLAGYKVMEPLLEKAIFKVLKRNK